MSASGKRNPIFFGINVDHWAALNPADIGWVTASRQSIIDSGAMVQDFDLGDAYGLEEIRVWGDVKVGGFTRASALERTPMATASRSRGIDYASAWEANRPLFEVVGDKPAFMGGNWADHALLANEQMSYTDALDPMRFLSDLLAKARQNSYVQSLGITTLYLVASGRGGPNDGGGHVYWTVGEMPVNGSTWSPTRVSMRGQYGRTAQPNPRFLNAVAYTRGEEARKWIGENLAGVVTDESMFADLAQTVTVYRGISLPPGVDPTRASRGDGWTSGPPGPRAWTRPRPSLSGAWRASPGHRSWVTPTGSTRTPG